MGRNRCSEFPDEVDRLYHLSSDDIGLWDPVQRIPCAHLIGMADDHAVIGLYRYTVLAGDRERSPARCPDPEHLARTHPPAGHLAHPSPASWCERGEILRAPLIAGEGEFHREDAPDTPTLHHRYGRAPVDTKRSRPEIFQVVDVEVAAEVVVREVRGAEGTAPY